jgi:hypothetical protein
MRKKNSNYIETLGHSRFVVVYTWLTGRWVHNDTYQLGFLEVYQGEYPEQHENVFDVGESIIYGKNEIISIEIERNSVYFVRFEVDIYGYWYMLIGLLMDLYRVLYWVQWAIYVDRIQQGTLGGAYKA